MVNAKDEVEELADKIIGVGKVGGVLAILLLGFILLTSVVWSVPPGFAGVIFSGTDGVKQYAYPEGWHLKIPFLESYDTIDCRVIVYNTDASAASKDLQTVQSKIALNYHVERDSAWILYRTIGHDYETRVIAPAIEESIRAITAKYNAEELITQREQVSTQVRDLITAKLKEFNIAVDAFNILNFDFSPEFNTAIESKQVAEQNAQKEKNILTQVQIQAQQKVAEAEGLKQSAILRAQGEANATLTNAYAQAESIRIQAEALKTNKELVDLKRVEKWDGQLPKFMMGGSTPLIMDASKIVESTG
jgi:prohibitin 2